MRNVEKMLFCAGMALGFAISLGLDLIEDRYGDPAHCELIAVPVEE